jgi:hypothetical protein
MGCLGWRMGRGVGDAFLENAVYWCCSLLGWTESCVCVDCAETYQRGWIPSHGLEVRDGAPLSSSTPLKTLLHAST